MSASSITDFKIPSLIRTDKTAALEATTRVWTPAVEQMGWRVIVTSFGMIFLAELGDKTQLAAITLAAQTRRPWEVLVGASLALVCVSGIGVLVGALVADYLPLIWIKRAALRSSSQSGY
jgi:putative Ca2+/H+ antiporter (TMEM165/GDT1 family)